MLVPRMLFVVLITIISSAYGLSWENSITNDSSTNISVEVNNTVVFSVYSNESMNVSWFVDENLVKSQANVSKSNLSIKFNETAVYTIKAVTSLGNVSWHVFVYEPLKIKSYGNNITKDNSTSFEMKLGTSALLYVNRSGTMLYEKWSINGTDIVNKSSIIFSPEKYGSYNIEYTAVGLNSNYSINFSIRVYLELTDATNTTVRFYREPRKIVSLAPSITEIICAVNMCSNLVAVDQYSDYPPEIENMSLVRLSGPYTLGDVDREKIFNLTPDLVIAAQINPITFIEDLRKLNITVFAIKSETLDEILENIIKIGKIGNKKEDAEKLVANLSERIEKVKSFSRKLDSRQKPKIFYVVWYPQLWTCGRGTYANDLIELAGGINIASDGNGWFIMNKETLIERDPDVIVCSGMGGYGSTVCSQIRNDSVLSNLRAVKNNKLYVVPDSNIVERPGPRIVEGLEFFYEIVKENLKPLPQSSTSTGGGGGGATYYAVSREKIFKKDFQTFDDVKEDIIKTIKYRAVYEVEDKGLAVPLLLSNRYPKIEGVKKRGYKINKDLYEYSAEVALSRFFFAKEVIIARGDLEVDSYASLALARNKNIPILFTKTDSVPEAILKAVERLKPRKIIIIGGEEAISKDVELELERYAEVERIWGDTRVETSIEIAKRLKPREVILSGYNSSLEAAVLSSMLKVPVIYVSKSKIEVVLDFLREHKPKIIFVNVEEELRKRIEDEI